jgi:hypothetical protein
MKTSSALKLLKHVWEHNGTTSWEALNHSMYTATELAIGAKLHWLPSDFDYISANFRPGYWLGELVWEPMYSLAVWTDGDSFIKAFETAKKREPFFANEVCGANWRIGASHYVHASSSHRQRGRIAWRSEVWLGGRRFECTSITNERVVLTSRDAKGKRTIKKLSHEDCRRLWPAPKKPKKQENPDVPMP